MGQIVHYGIDLSKHNGEVDFKKVVRDGYTFVILRAGYGQSASQKDTKFEQYYAQAKEAGLCVGAYWFTYAKTPDIAAKEANACLECIKGKKFEYPIYYDIENDEHSKSYPLNTGKENCSAMVRAFLDIIEKAGYCPGLYTSSSVLDTHIADDIRNHYAIWVADWRGYCGYKGTYGMWQRCETGKVSGINGNVDLDIAYVDYPTLVMEGGLNGYSKSEAVKPVDGKTFYRVYVGGDFEKKADAEALAGIFKNAKIVKVTK